MIIDVHGTKIHLLAQRAAFFPMQKVLVVADMHLGKLIHFRRNGIFIPIPKANEDLAVLTTLIERFEPKEVVFLGDLFHSEMNSEYRQLINTLSLFPTVKFTLTKGNHDIIPDGFFSDNRIAVVEEKVLGNNIVLMHQMPKHPSSTSFYVIGHVHPGYKWQGKGRQSYRLPCFHQTVYSLTLPAFGAHTGLFIPEFSSSDRVYVIMNHDVIQFPIGYLDV